MTRYVAPVLIVALAAGCDERRASTEAPVASTRPSAESGSSGAAPPPAPKDPFEGLTPARIDALDAEGLCFEPCRVNLECAAKRNPAAYPSVASAVDRCRIVCVPARVMKAEPIESAAVRSCLKKLDCEAYQDCLFGAALPSRPPASASPPAASAAPPAASAPPPAEAPPSSPLPPPSRCPEGMVAVAGDAFTMGSPNPAHDTPEHTAHVGSFCIGKTEVTVAEYLSCASAGRCPPASKQVFYIGESQDHGREPSHDVFCNARRPGAGKHPMNCVDLDAATKYCAWKGGRLPTEEEWEYAARGRDGRLFPWGDVLVEGQALTNECGAACKEHLAKLGPVHYPLGNGWPDTAPVGSFPKNASPFGVLDMVGSVEEWTASDPCKGVPPLSSYPCAPNQAVVRGGGGLPAFARFERNWQSQRPALGFRCAHPGKGPP